MSSLRLKVTVNKIKRKRIRDAVNRYSMFSVFIFWFNERKEVKHVKWHRFFYAVVVCTTKPLPICSMLISSCYRISDKNIQVDLFKTMCNRIFSMLFWQEMDPEVANLQSCKKILFLLNKKELFLDKLLSLIIIFLYHVN